MGATTGEQAGHGGARRQLEHGEPPEEDRDAPAPALRLPAAEAALSPLHAGARRARSAACPRRQFLEVAEALCDELGPRADDGVRATRSAGRSTRSASSTSAPRRSSSSCSATSAGRAAASWRCAGTRRSRARPTSRRSTTSCPGYLPMPHAHAHADLDELHRAERVADRLLGQLAAPTCVSLLKAWWGDAATADERLLLRLPAADHRRPLASTRRVSTCSTAKVQGLHRRWARTRPSARRTRSCTALRDGEARLARRARPRRDRDGLVLVRRARDRDRRARRPRRSRPRSSSCRPPRTSRRTARSRTRSGCCSGTARRSSPRATAAPSSGSTYHLGRMIREKLRRARRTTTRPAAARPHLGLPDVSGEIEEPSAEAVLREINGCGRRRDALCRLHGAEGRRLDGVRLLDLLRLLRRRRQPGRPPQEPGSEQTLGRARVGLGVAGEPAHPLQPRLGRPRRASRGRSASATSGGTRSREVDGRRRARLRGRQAARLRAARRRHGPRTRSRGDHPFIMQADGRGWLFAPSGLVDGPLPTHYEPHESPFENPLYAQQRESRARSSSRAARTATTRRRRPGRDVVPVRRDDLPADRAPHAGGMCRSLPVPRRSCSRRCSAR